MLELAILGLLHEEQVHGYELRRRLSLLIGRPISQGGFYSAISRLKQQGLITRHQQLGNPGVPRQVLSLTPAGAEELIRRVRSTSEIEISDRYYFFAMLAFLGYLRPEEQRTVLERRLAFLEGERSYFSTESLSKQLDVETDHFRRGILLISQATISKELEWLRDAINRIDELISIRPQKQEDS